MTHFYRIIRRYAVVSFMVSLSSGCASRSRDTSDITRPFPPETHAEAVSTPSGLKSQGDPQLAETPITDLVLPSDVPSVGPAAGKVSQADGFEVIYFGLDDSTLSASDRDTLGRNFNRMRTKKGVEFSLEGHCDERGDGAYNTALGERRASTVKKYLMALGLSEAKLLTVSFGKEKPSDPGHNEASWAKNRRVEIRQR
jgi:peptidoglycan-associated lipoprotein